MSKTRLKNGIACLGVLFTCTQCGHFTEKDGLPSYTPNIHAINNPVPKALPLSEFGNPSSYVAAGKRYYVLDSAKGYQKIGVASWYGTKFHGRLTSSREPYNMFAMTAASPDLPIPTFVRVKNLDNNHEIIVKVNDRGPFAPNRIIDLSYVAARKLGMIKHGTARVRVTAIDPHAPTTQPYNILQDEDDQDADMNDDEPIYLQLGSFTQSQNAKQLQKQLQDTLHHAVRIEVVNRPNKPPLHKVMIGPLKSMNTSLKLATHLQSLGYHGEIKVNH